MTDVLDIRQIAEPVNDSVVVPFNGIVAAPNAFVIVGGLATDKLAVAVLPVPPFVEVTLPVVFEY